MWELINDCGKQLNYNYRIRQTVGGEDVYVTEYKILEINIDDYVVHILSKTKNAAEVPADSAETLVLTCKQILDYQFEVWVEA